MMPSPPHSTVTTDEGEVRRWLLQHFSPHLLEQLARHHVGGPPVGQSSTIRQLVTALSPSDRAILRFVREGGGAPPIRALRRMMQHVLHVRGRLPLVWLIANPPGHGLLTPKVRVQAGGDGPGRLAPGQSVQINGQRATLRHPASSTYAVRYANGASWSSVAHANMYARQVGDARKQQQYSLGERVWVQVPGQSRRTPGTVTAIHPRWTVRWDSSGDEEDVKTTRIGARPSRDGEGEASLPWWASWHGWRRAAATRERPHHRLRGVWSDAKRQARQSAQAAVEEVTRQALREIEESARQGAAAGMARVARRDSVEQRTKRGAQRGVVTAEQERALLSSVHKGAVAGVLGDAATAEPAYEYEEAAQVPVEVQGALPTPQMRVARCMSQCTDAGACDRGRCTRTGATPLLQATGGTPLHVLHDGAALQGIAPLLCSEWAEVAQVEAEGKIRLCAPCRAHLLAMLKLHSPNTLLLVRG